MTDLTAYESALVERVARALCEDVGFKPDLPVADGDEHLVWHEYTADAEAALRALGLLGPSRTAWIAPWEATAGMHIGARDWSTNEYRKPIGIRASDLCYRAMRDAHLKEGGA